MTPREKFLQHVELKHYKAGDRHGVFKCPAHDDKRASASWRELDDGRLLVHCFAGCSVEEIVAAVGLKLEDLFPERPGDHRQAGERRSFAAIDALRCVDFECLVVVAAATSLAKGKPLSPTDHERLLVAAERIRGAARGAGL